MIGANLLLQRNDGICFDLRTLVQDTMLNFPNEVNRQRKASVYGVDEAYDMLRSSGAVAQLNFDLALHTDSTEVMPKAIDNLCSTLNQLIEECTDKPFASIFTLPPYSILICKPLSEKASVVDTHSVLDTNRGNFNAAIISARFEEADCHVLRRRLFHRFRVEMANKRQNMN